MRDIKCKMITIGERRREGHRSPLYHFFHIFVGLELFQDKSLKRDFRGKCEGQHYDSPKF